MRPTLRLLTARLAPFSPTGLTGLLTHPNPRPTLIALYNHTLTLLSQLPAHSVYRQSTENLTRQRLNLVEAVKPAEYEAYKQELEAAKERAGMKDRKDSAFQLGLAVTQTRSVLEDLVRESSDMTVRDYFATETGRWSFPPMPGPATVLKEKPAEAPPHGALFGPGTSEESPAIPLFPVEPQLTEEQVSGLEEKFGGGLIEEVIDQGWAELNLVEDMHAAKVWEELEVVPEEGQWVGFERKP
ncbi:hypothetical protein Q9L58_006354 [Maublancomyces gigas]|uniref:Uncharacterized protein n=1 Tax=Discina gigas TaxID=1032678 RepID=A0ABR3GFE8_9PEZI